MKTKSIFGWPQLLALCGLFGCHNAFAFYNPSTGRWLSRDPIEEHGGANSYCAALNDLANKLDPVGLKTITFVIANDETLRGAFDLTPKSWT
ncbi:MAG TPA: RHS repeat-associated core domain-containing protein [Candidatus Angelobacter sp.]|nr:RHS repeat-associated core domain-containing protein [Candidatus Angelobacter sp.]